MSGQFEEGFMNQISHVRLAASIDKPYYRNSVIVLCEQASKALNIIDEQEAKIIDLIKQNSDMKSALEDIAADRFGVAHSELYKISIERRDIARKALDTVKDIKYE